MNYELGIFCTFAITDGEITPSRQKKKLKQTSI